MSGKLFKDQKVRLKHAEFCRSVDLKSGFLYVNVKKKSKVNICDATMAILIPKRSPMAFGRLHPFFNNS